MDKLIDLPLQCFQEHEEFEKPFLCNDLLFLWLLCHSELHKVVEILQFGPPAKTEVHFLIQKVNMFSCVK